MDRVHFCFVEQGNEGLRKVKLPDRNRNNSTNGMQPHTLLVYGPLPQGEADIFYLFLEWAKDTGDSTKGFTLCLAD